MKLLHALLISTILTTGTAAFAAGDHAAGHGQTQSAATSHDAMGHGGGAHDGTL